MKIAVFEICGFFSKFLFYLFLFLINKERKATFIADAIFYIFTQIKTISIWLKFILLILKTF